MFKYYPKRLAIAGLATFVTGTIASTAINAEEWTGEGGAGIVIVSGNSDSETINANLNLTQEIERWENSAKLAVTKAESNGEDSAESYLAAFTTRYNFSEREFWFGDIRYKDDKFDSFTGITTISAGYGYRIFDTETLKWSVQAGPGYQDTEYEATGEDANGLALTGESDFSYQITETTKLIDEFRVESTDDNTYVQNIAGVSLAISTKLSLKLTYDVRYNSDPDDGDTTTDKTTSVNVVYKI